VEYPELGMEAIWRIEVEDFPAFIVIDDKGNDFFKELNLGGGLVSRMRCSASEVKRCVADPGPLQSGTIHASRACSTCTHLRADLG
jgi:hypothetical protein